MNIEIANRLLGLRKQHNLSQEELASRLGISRQSVSKWERAEASPDTDNLIALAKLYGVSLDQLLLDEQPQQESAAEEEDTAAENNQAQSAPRDKVYIGKDGIHLHDKDGDSVHLGFDGIRIDSDDLDIEDDHWFKHSHDEKRSPWRSFPFPVLVTIIFLLLGFLGGWWHPGWLVFISIPIYYAIVNHLDKQHDNPWRAFPYPLVAAIVYLLLGFCGNWWHPGWLIFLTIPLYYWLASMADRN